jgi:hypothetical protein
MKFVRESDGRVFVASVTMDFKKGLFKDKIRSLSIDTEETPHGIERDSR